MRSYCVSNANHQHTTDEQDYDISLVVGSIFNYTPQDDREMYEEERELVAQLQDYLRQEGIEYDFMANPGAVIWEGGIKRYGDLYRLSQVAIYLEQGHDITPLLNKKFDENEDIDPLLSKVLEEEIPTRFPHFIRPDGDPFYYIPVEFSSPIDLFFDDEDEDDERESDDESVERISVGSASALQRELYQLHGYLMQMQVPEKHPVMRCLAALRQAAELSVSNDLPITVW